MTLAATRQFKGLTRGHALVLTSVCAAILFLGLASPRGNWAPVDWHSQPGKPNEDAIDATLQDAATTAMGNREGTIIVMDPQSGRIRAVVNPQVAFAQAAMPGSTMKPFAALAALQAGLIDTNSRTVCPGRFTGLSFSLPCVHKDHLPPFTPSQAIAYSCNYYFATLGQRIGSDGLVETLRPFGFGRPTGVTNEEAAGTMRPCETGNRARIRSSGGDRISPHSDCDARAAIGESDHIEVTPIQLLDAYAALVNGGHLFQPRVAGASEFHSVERGTITITPEHRAAIAEGMAGAVRYGTAKSAHLDSLSLQILGKTGTSLPPKGFRSNGWFVGFAGQDLSPVANSSKPNSELDPGEINLAVMVFLKRSHGAEAAAVSKSIFQAYADARSNTASPETDSLPPPDKSAIENRQSSIRVHLVRENVTQELSLKDYVLGVMRAEGSMETEPEALKALAIAIRTYAMTNRGRHAKDGYDFCSTTHCQRFVEGNASPMMVDAVKATAGQVLLDNRGQLADAYFSASCGGETANLGALWGKSPPEYLRGVHDEFCVTGPHANWTDVIRRPDLVRALQSDARTDVGSRLERVVVSKRDESGRAEFITLEGEHRKIVRGWDFKIIVGRVLGWNLLKSSRFQVARSGSDFIFRGSGFGHGLGLCQEGAHVMAQRGANYARILAKYFPGTSVAPHGGEMSLARPFKAEDEEPVDRFVALATSEYLLLQPSLTRRTDPHGDPNPALKGRATVTRRYAADLLPGLPPASSTSLNPPKFLILSSDHFRVTYPAGVDRRDANLVLDTLESARSDFLRRATAASIVVPGIPTLEIRLNDSTGDFTSRTGQPWWAAAATRENRIELQPVGLLKRRGVLTTTLRHEFAHAIIDAVSHDRAPRWLEEGFAIYLAGEGAMISRYATKARMTADELEQKLERPSSQQGMRALYAAAYQKVIELVRDANEAAVWKQLAEY